METTPLPSTRQTDEISSKYQGAQTDILPWIKYLEDDVLLSIERQHNKMSQLYKYIDALIAHTTKLMIGKVVSHAKNIDERLAALQENAEKNLISLKWITRGNDEKILETTSNSNKSSMAQSITWLGRRMDAAEVKAFLMSFHYIYIPFV